MIAALKAAHIIALCIWCAGLILLPILLHIYGRRPEMRSQAGFTEFRWLTHYSYIAVITPAAVIAVSVGTVLIFALEVLSAWMLAKLIAVAGMVLLHAWMGHLIVQAGEGRGDFHLPMAGLSLLALVPLIGLVLWLVLAKPSLEELIALLPSILQEPRGNPIPARLNPL
ncbi:CopD family protein [Roseinatronobacter monicus]|uniref:CopD family protein n=1 Tax=Roseinatronobacter monicus TaxID=393481 RepID=UPI003F3F73B6